MADFLKAYRRTCQNEGGYANHPNDRGGETWRGIARNFWPSWAGWAIVDRIKPQCKNLKSLNAALFADQELAILVHSFYKQYFWDVCLLDRVESQLLAENVFDTAVNCGTGAGAKFLQQAINVLKPDAVIVDGKIGNKTLAAANSLGTALVSPYIEIRKGYHSAIVAKNPSQRVFFKTWINRCEAMRKEV